MSETFFYLHPIFSLLLVFCLGTILGAWLWSQFGTDTRLAKMHERLIREQNRTERSLVASHALAQRLLYVCDEHKIHPFPACDSRISGLVRGEGCVYVPPASFIVPSTNDWEEQAEEAKGTATFRFQMDGTLRLESVDTFELGQSKLEFRLRSPTPSARASSGLFG